MPDEPQKRTLPPAQRSPAEPILTSRTGNEFWWESNGVFNPGVTEYNGKILLLYRAYDTFRISRFGLATSDDGVHFTQQHYPAIDLDPNDTDERLGIEDPRITKIDSTYYIVHTAASYHPVGHVSDVVGVMDYIPMRVRVAMHSTKDWKKFHHHDVLLLDIPAKNGCLLPEKIDGRFALYYREKTEVSDILKIAFSTDLKSWKDTQTITWPPPDPWQAFKFGLGSQPIALPAGYLMVYHAVDADKVYRLGLMMMDRRDPTRILWQSNSILQPELPYERVGFIPNVVYSCGALIRNNELWIYYGAADHVIARAVLPLKDAGLA